MSALTPLALTFADILRHLLAGDVGHTHAEVAKATGRDTSNTRRDMGKLADAGLIVGMGGDPPRYILTGAGGEALKALARAEGGEPATGFPVWPLEGFRRNPDQPRKIFPDEMIADRAESIVQVGGLLHPLVVDPADASGVRMIQDGECRWRAAQLLADEDRLPDALKAGLPYVERAGGEAEMLKVALIANAQRSDLTPWEDAKGLKRLKDLLGLSARGVAMAIGRAKEGSERGVGDVQQKIRTATLASANDIALHEAGKITWEELRSSAQEARKLSPHAALAIVELRAKVEEVGHHPDDTVTNCWVLTDGQGARWASHRELIEANLIEDRPTVLYGVLSPLVRITETGEAWLKKACPASAHALAAGEDDEALEYLRAGWGRMEGGPTNFDFDEGYTTPWLNARHLEAQLERRRHGLPATAPEQVDIEEAIASANEHSAVSKTTPSQPLDRTPAPNKAPQATEALPTDHLEKAEYFSQAVREAALAVERSKPERPSFINHAKLSGTTTAEGETWPATPTEHLKTPWDGYPQASIDLAVSDKGRWHVATSTQAGGPDYSGQGSPPYVYTNDPIFRTRTDALNFAARKIVWRLGEWGKKRKLHDWFAELDADDSSASASAKATPQVPAVLSPPAPKPVSLSAKQTLLLAELADFLFRFPSEDILPPGPHGGSHGLDTLNCIRFEGLVGLAAPKRVRITETGRRVLNELSLAPLLDDTAGAMERRHLLFAVRVAVISENKADALEACQYATPWLNTEGAKAAAEQAHKIASGDATAWAAEQVNSKALSHLADRVAGVLTMSAMRRSFEDQPALDPREIPELADLAVAELMSGHPFVAIGHVAMIQLKCSLAKLGEMAPDAALSAAADRWKVSRADSDQVLLSLTVGDLVNNGGASDYRLVSRKDHHDSRVFDFIVQPILNGKDHGGQRALNLNQIQRLGGHNTNPPTPTALALQSGADLPPAGRAPHPGPAEPDDPERDATNQDEYRAWIADALATNHQADPEAASGFAIEALEAQTAGVKFLETSGAWRRADAAFDAADWAAEHLLGGLRVDPEQSQTEGEEADAA